MFSNENLEEICTRKRIFFCIQIFVRISCADKVLELEDTNIKVVVFFQNKFQKSLEEGFLLATCKANFNTFPVISIHGHHKNNLHSYNGVAFPVHLIL